MQRTSELLKIIIDKLTVGILGSLTRLLSICLICAAFVLIWPSEIAEETVLLPTVVPTESLSAETPTRPLPTATPTEPLPTETLTQLPPTESPEDTLPTETPTTEAKPIVTAAESVNLRNGPSTDHEVVGTLSAGERIEIVGRNVDASWWQVSTPNGLAWVAASVVTATTINMDDGIPVAEAPPPPIQPTPTEPPPQPTVQPKSSETVLDHPSDPRVSSDLSHQLAEACFDYCAPTDESYGDLAVNGGPTNPPAEEHPDLNLALRSYQPINAYKGLVHYNGESDPKAPQLPGLFADNRTATFSAVYRVYGWDWEWCDCRDGLLTDPEVTMVGLAVTPGETIYVPDSGYTIGEGYEVLVLYASSDRITLKYTPDDHVVWGYTLHVENICVEPRLLVLYQSWNEAGRGHLPALRAGQALGCARDSEIRIVIRDRGDFMDPRSGKDWWQGR